MTAPTLYLEHFQLNRVPFGQEPDTGIFYPAGDRENILKGLLADIEHGKPLVKLTGSEGTGKTLLCRLLEQSLDLEKYLLVSMEHPIGSYDDFLRSVCIALGTVEDEYLDEDAPPPDYATLFRQHLRQIELDGKKLVLLVDEAEHLFLATLERLVRLLCDTENIRNLQILLAGRLDLDVSLEQLAVYCSGIDITSGYTLEPLSLEETKQYIHFRLQGAGGGGDKYLTIFTDDAIEMIYQTARGNISLTNSLAEQGMRRASEEGMFQVDEELILSDQSLEENVSLAVFQGYDFVRDNKWWLIAGTLVVWVLLMFLWPGGNRNDESAESDVQLEIITPEQEIIVPPDPEVEEIIESETAPAVAEEAKSQVVSSETTEEITAKREVKKTGQEKKQVIEVRPLEEKQTARMKKEVVVEPGKTKKTVAVRSQPVAVEKAPPRDADELFDERIKASSSWLAWAYRGGYTIQLMVLASDKAEKNLKKILVDERYYAVKDHLYILKKRSPRTIYLFYGNYETMEEARQVRNKMPPFLRANQPYVLSIKDALDKTRR